MPDNDMLEYLGKGWRSLVVVEDMSILEEGKWFWQPRRLYSRHLQLHLALGFSREWFKSWFFDCEITIYKKCYSALTINLHNHSNARVNYFQSKAPYRAKTAPAAASANAGNPR